MVEKLTNRKRALIRLAFGQLQIIGATAALVLLLQTGLSAPAVWAAAITAALSLTSILFLRVLWRDKTRDQQRPPTVQGVFHWPPKL